MQQSNAYILGFTALVTIVLGGLLAFTAISLQPRQDVQIELDTKKKILSSVVDLGAEMTSQEILSMYDERVQSFIIDASGNKVDSELSAEEIDISKQYSKPENERQLPVFALRDEVDPTKFEAYIVSVYGKGLWGPIWGFVALGEDMNTIKGTVFDHKTETPGLGARITDKEVQERFVGKTIFEEGELVSIEVVKGEGKDPAKLSEHQVDGLSGASMTTKGVNKMLEDFLGSYKAFLLNVKGNGVASYLDADKMDDKKEEGKQKEEKKRSTDNVIIHDPVHIENE